MTALSEYQRLESRGLWRDGPAAQRREVIVSFGDASLMIGESPSGRHLSHWSLPAIQRCNPGHYPALYIPDAGSSEELELDDPTMIAALDKVQALIARRQPHPGRVRGLAALGAFAAMVAVGLLWLPGALIDHTASVLPAASRDDIGKAVLADLTRLTGSPCAAPDAQPVLDGLGDRLLDGREGHLYVLPQGLAGAVPLPGGSVALGRGLIEGHDTPEVAAGYVLAEEARAAVHDPLRDALGFAGLSGAIRLLTTGKLPPDALKGYGEVLLSEAPPAVAPSVLLKRFEERGVSATPYAQSLGIDDPTAAPLVAGDPFASEPPTAPVLNDFDWVTLQGICAS